MEIWNWVCGGSLNPDGSLKWKYETGDTVESSPAIGLDGTIYVGSLDHYLYAIKSKSFGLAKSSWPKFKGNLQNTGNKRRR